ncbi:hypothetical protein DXG03_004788 [Asterophora parasitica]|uniref:Uncharacterized protein n=1 Tax=Asterophora parasitica TaxID=117018 RepID=A0A9P7G3R8_9AGAR|nr:hypothetical protein DXG03_004788 [Asterophora parasitica]
MPALPSFISYRPKRKTKTPLKVSSPLPVQNPLPFSSPHTYASPRILDINDGLPNPAIPDPEANPYFSVTNTPRVQLDVEIDPEPLTDWFPTTLLNSEPFALSREGEHGQTPGASGSGALYGNGYDVPVARGNDGGFQLDAERETISVEEYRDESGDEQLRSLNSAEYVTELGAIDASNLVAELGMERYLEPSQASSKKSAPSPIKIPNAALHGPQIQLIRPTEFSRPISQISSSESSAVSGTTLARALLANTFVLSGETRASRYRSGASNMTRIDSATLPQGEFSPYWRDRTSVEVALSPGSAVGPVPPVPDNADLVYVPPQAKPRVTSASGSLHLDRDEEGEHLHGQQNQENTRASHHISREIEATYPQPSTSQLAYTLSEGAEHDGPGRDAAPPLPPKHSHRYSITPSSKGGSDIIPEAITSLSDAPSSAKYLDNVLDYYSFADSPEPTVERNFRLPFSPITEVTEESSSQLSPPTPYRSDSRGSKRSLPPGRFFLGSTPSASIGGVRVDWNVRSSTSGRKESVSKVLLPYGDRPGVQVAEGSINSRSSNPSASPSSSHSTPDPSTSHLPPPSGVFNRLRSGSAPSPIKVVRDLHDLTAYNITVTPRTGGSTSSTPTTGDSDIVQQTFPETPSAFTPGFSPNGITSPGMRGPSAMGDYMSMGPPQTPMSAFLPTAGNLQPSLVQQVLLTRAATSVRGARHSRQASLTKLMRQQGHPYPQPTSIVMSNRAPTLADQASSSQVGQGTPGSTVEYSKVAEAAEASQEPMPPLISGSRPVVVVERPSPIEAEPRSSQPNHTPEAPALNIASLSYQTPPTVPSPLAEPPTTPSSSSHGSEEAVLAYAVASGYPSVEHSRAPSRTGSKRSDASTGSPKSMKYLPRLYPAPRMPSAPTDFPAPLPPSKSPPAQILERSLGHSNDGPSSSSMSSLGAKVPPPQRGDISPVDRNEPTQTPTPMDTPVASTSTLVSSSPLTGRRPKVISQLISNAHVSVSSSSLYSLSYDARMSPPSYFSVINSDRAAGESTPTGGSYDQNFRFGTPVQEPHSPPPNGREFAVGTTADRMQPKGSQTMNNPRRPRVRPPLPAGPRRPSQLPGSLPFSSMAAMRDRSGSVSSVGSQIPSGRRVPSVPLPSPRFQTSPLKWRGYTMDAAKWTFTSTQLQAIVSRAIKQSSEASSIRLLRLETLDKDIPEEVERLETLRTDTKSKYKTLARRRANKLDSLASCLATPDQDCLALAIRLTAELKEISGAMDKLTEELHSVDEQLSQLTQLCQGHSTSALAMALGKLYGSFQKQFAEAQALRQQVEALEAERDEAWKQAEDVAHDYEDLRSGKIESPEAENRFIRVASVRKSSVRATKAGLRNTSIRSNQRASTGSTGGRGYGANTPSSSRSTYTEDLPPVPPLPRHRPVDIKTNLPLRTSTVTGLSVEGPTPTSETRAMVRAQDELYEMLGIHPNERARRSRSVIGVPGESEFSQHLASPSYSDVPPNTGRRASLPGSAPVTPGPFNALTADVSIILTSDRAGWI